MAEWSEAQVSEWISLIDLPDGCSEAAQEVFSDVDGEELLTFIPKTLQKLLRKAGLNAKHLVHVRRFKPRAQKAVEASWTFGYKSPDAISGVISLYDDRFWTSGGCPQYSKEQFSVYDDRPKPMKISHDDWAGAR